MLNMDIEDRVQDIVDRLKAGKTVKILTVNVLPLFLELESRKAHYALPSAIRVKQERKRTRLRLKETR